MNPSHTHSESHNHHKRSNFSFDSQKPKEKLPSQRQEYNKQPLLYSDIVTLLHCDKFMIGLADITQLSPGAISITQSNSYLLGMFEILPISSNSKSHQIKIGDKFYIKNVQSNLYLCAQQELLKKFTNICFAKQYSAHCEFTIERSSNNNSGKIVYNRELIKMRNVLSGLYLHIEQQIVDTIGKYRHLWLSQIGDQFKVMVLNRSKQYPELLNNNDIILLSYTTSEKKYIGVAKRHNLYEVNDKESNNLSIEVNHQYYSIDNCFVDYYSEESGRKSIPCLWRVVRNTFDHNFTFLIRAKQDSVCLQHLQTGLFLQLDSNNIFTLKTTEAPIKMENLNKFKTQFSIGNKYQPIYISHSVGVTFPIIQKKYYLQRVQGKKYVILYFSQYLSFFQNLIKTMLKPRELNQSREELVRQIRLYVFIYQQLQDNLEQFADKGFYFFQYTLKILQLLKTILKDEKLDYHSNQFQIRRVLLNPLIVQIIKFISLIIIRNQTFIKITSQDHKKTKEIIQIIFVLYHFHFQYTLNLMVSLASTDPDLVVRLLSQNIYKHHHFQQRVALISTINQIIDQFRRINFDQKNLKAILQKQHKLIMNQSGIYISFQRKEHSIFDLFESLQKYDCNSNQQNMSLQQKQRQKQTRQTFYFYYYLLSIIRILFSNKADQLIEPENMFPKSQYSIRERSEHNIKDNKFMRNLIVKLSQQYSRNKNIKARIIIWELIYEFSSQIYHKEFITYNKLNFIVYDNTALQSVTPLANVLKVIHQNTLEWIFPKEQLIYILQEILDPQWEVQYQLNTKLKLLSNIINFLIAIVITSTYDLSTLNLIQKFGIDLLRIYDRNNKVSKNPYLIKYFGVTQESINEYNKRVNFVIVDGVKLHLDNLMIKLNSFFQAIFIQKKRLYIYPMYHNRDVLFEFAYFKDKYGELIINKRIKKSIRSIQNLLQLNEQKLQVSGLVLSREELQAGGMNEQGDDKHSKGVKLIQRIIEDLDCLAIIMESFRLYGQDKYLKENMVASMTLKIMNIEGLLKTVYKNKIYYKYSDAFNLSSHLFQFIIENSFEQDLILPLLQSLEDRVMGNHNVFVLIKENIDYFFNLLVDSATFKTSRIILRWVAKQIQNMPSPIHVKEYQFLYVEAVKLIETQVNINLLFLINILKEIGLHHPLMQQVIYSKLISHPQIQSFLINDCSSVRSFRSASEKLYKDHHLFYQQYQTSLQSVSIFRICTSYPHLMSHLNNLIPYQQIRQIMQEHQLYFLSRPLLTYIINELNSQAQVQLINLYIISISEHLSQYKNYMRQLDNYRVRYSLLKDKEGKAQTHLCRSNSLAPNFPKNILDDIFFSQKQFYWEFLYWIPFYNKAEGLLVNLEQIIKLIIHKDCNNQNIDDNLQRISKYLQEIKNMVSKSDEHKQFLKQMRNIVNLIKIIKNSKKMRGKKTNKNDQQIDQIYKTLHDNDLMKPFLCKLIPPLIKTSTFPKLKSQSQYTSAHELQIHPTLLQYQSSIVESQNISGQDKSKHSLISPQQNESRYLVEEQYFNLLQFINKLKEISEYKIRLYDKLLHMLLQYFEKGGSLVMLEYKLKQQITAHTNLMVEYKEIDYKLEKQVVKSNGKDKIFKPINLQMPFGISIIDISKVKELIKNNQLTMLSIILKEILLKFNDDQWIDLHKNDETNQQMQNILLCLFRLISCEQYEILQIIQCCLSLVNILTKHSYQRHSCEYLNELYSTISLFMYQVSYRYQSNYQLYHKIIILFGTIQFKYLKSYNRSLQQFIIKSITTKMPKTLYHYSMHQIINMNIDMVQNSKKIVSIESFSMALQFISQQFALMIEGSYFSQNMDFYQNHKLIVSILNLLQLILTHSSIPSNYEFAPSIIATLIRYEHLIYQNVYEQISLIANKSRLQLYQSLTVQILSFFHTFNFIKSSKIIAKFAFQAKDSILLKDQA